MILNRPISINVIRRLPRYLRILEELVNEGVARVSSAEIAKKMDSTPSQVRQDFSQYGSFGQQGFGYDVKNLRDEFLHILGIDRGYRIVLAGVGDLGTAIIDNFDFIFKGYTLLAAFDADEKKAGTIVGGTKVYPADQLMDFVRDNPTDIGIITVPRAEARKAAASMAEAGVRAIWNFTGVELECDDVLVEDIHFSDSLLVLTYKLAERDLEDDPE